MKRKSPKLLRVSHTVIKLGFYRNSSKDEGVRGKVK